MLLLKYVIEFGVNGIISYMTGVFLRFEILYFQWLWNNVHTHQYFDGSGFYSRIWRVLDQNQSLGYLVLY